MEARRVTRIEALKKLLKALGADKKAHSGRTLYDHLVGVHDMLKAAGCEEAVCLAGAAHSLYGTSTFRHQTLQHAQRHALVRIIGPRAEKLAYTFGTINRPRAIEDGDSEDLKLVEAANLIEQGGSLAKWPNIRAAWERQTKKDAA